MEISAAILDLKKKLNAVILAHNYQLPEVQDIADFTGDSLGLSIEAARTEANIILFCGVYFMAETAKILSPEKRVLIPEKTAGCPMADMITAEDVKRLKEQNPSATTVCYVNTSAEVKAECDVCCTSANAVELLKQIKKAGKEIIFVPDKYLGSYAASQAGVKATLWDGYCPTHALILPEHVEKMKSLHPKAKVLMHPECNSAVIELADAVLSTSGMLNYVNKSADNEFIVGTEVGMVYPLEKENPDKEFYPISDMAVCPDMKKTTLDKILLSLRTFQHEVTLPEDIIKRARVSIDRMIKGINSDL